jgi:peptidylprolyl isomerase
MKQLYIIGIAVAVILLLLLGLSKLNNPPVSDSTENPATVIETLEEKAPDTQEVQEQTLQDLVEPVTEQTSMNATDTFAGNTTVVMKTNKGDITIELFTKDMPITAGNFLKLAQDDFYDGIKFHRVIDGFMIQGGDPNSKDDAKRGLWGTGGPGYAIQDEFVPGFSNVRGTLSMANSGPNSGGSQFFINTVDNVNLDYDKQPLSSKHPVFGRVVSGMEVVDAISKVATGPGDVPVDAVSITDIVVQ